MTIPPRALVAAQVVARDYAHLMGPVTCTVRLKASVIETILRHAGRTRYSAFHPTSYDTAPLALHALPGWVTSRIRTGTRNKRLNAAIKLALATASTISFEIPESRTGAGAITVDLDLGGIGSHSQAARAELATWLRIEHSQAIVELRNRGGSSLCHLDFPIDERFDLDAYPADADRCIDEVMERLRQLGEWVRQVAGQSPATTAASADAVAPTDPDAPDAISFSMVSNDYGDRLLVRDEYGLEVATFTGPDGGPAYALFLEAARARGNVSIHDEHSGRPILEAA